MFDNIQLGQEIMRRGCNSPLRHMRCMRILGVAIGCSKWSHSFTLPPTALVPTWAQRYVSEPDDDRPTKKEAPSAA